MYIYIYICVLCIILLGRVPLTSEARPEVRLLVLSRTPPIRKADRSGVGGDPKP